MFNTLGIYRGFDTILTVSHRFDRYFRDETPVPSALSLLLLAKNGE